MVDFSLSAEQKQVRDFAHEFARAVVRPLSLDADRTGQVPQDFLSRLAKFQGGFSMGGIPKAHGGDGEGVGEVRNGKGESQTNRIAMIAAEEMAWGDIGIMMNLPGPGLGAPPVRLAGTPEQQERFFGLLKQPGLHYGAYALTEPGAGSDVAALVTTCRKDGDDYVLDGRKCFITNGARADWVVVFATVDRAQGRAGHRAFVVERGTPGFTVGKIEKKMGLRASETAELVFDQCRVPVANLLGGEERYRTNEGFLAAMKTFDSTRPLVGILAVGIARAAYEYARDFARRGLLNPLSRAQRVADILTTCRRRLDAARVLCWRAAWMADLKIENAREASEAKAYAARVAMAVCRDVVQLLGAHGLERHHLVEKWYRDIKVFDIFEGTGQIQRIVIAKRILKDPPTF